MKVICIQMNMAFCRPDENFTYAAELIEKAMEEKPDVLVLPETWNTGFYPRENLKALCDNDGQRVKAEIGGLAAKHRVNIVAGSVSNLRDGKVYNTAMVFDREGRCIASYDKIHRYSPMGEDKFYVSGDHLCRFQLDGIDCGVIICYDVRFPELARSLALQGMDMLFVVAQWPQIRLHHLRTLTTARAIENQMFVVCCNSCGEAGEDVYCGSSAVIDPWGETLALAGNREELLTAECNMETVAQVRSRIPVFRDRQPELYEL